MNNTKKINSQGYITAIQYAEIKGVSKQAIYQQFDSNLKEQVIKLYGVKAVPISVLTEEEKQKFQENQAEFQESQADFQENQTNSSQENQENQANSQAEFQESQANFQEIQADYIAFLRQQIEAKDKQISSLTAQLENSNAREKQLAQLIENSQILLAQKTLPAETVTIQDQPHKKGFFHIFRRNK